MLTLDGNMMLTERDEFIYDEMIAHVPMSVHRQGHGCPGHRRRRRRRCAGADPLRPGWNRSTWWKLTRQVVEAVAREYLPQPPAAWMTAGCHIYFENALKFIRNCEDEYDLIIVDSTDPFGPSEGLFTREFYGNCYNALKEDGIMVNQQGSPFYAEDADACSAATSALQHLPHQPCVPGTHPHLCRPDYWLFGFAAKNTTRIDDLDPAPGTRCTCACRYYTTRLHDKGAFYLPAFLEELLREVEVH